MPKTVLVTGANGQLGHEICNMLASKGFTIIAVTRSKLSKNRPNELRKLGATNAFNLLCNFGALSCRRLVSNATYHTKLRIDAIVTAHGHYIDSSITNLKNENMEVLFRANCSSHVLIAQGAFLHCQENSEHVCAMLTVSSIAGFGSRSGNVMYAASKAALHGTILSGQNWGEFGFHMFGIAPGPFEGKMIQGRGYAAENVLSRAEVANEIFSLINGDTDSKAASVTEFEKRAGSILRKVHRRSGISDE